MHRCRAFHILRRKCSLLSILVSYLASVAAPLKLQGIFVKDADIFRDDTVKPPTHISKNPLIYKSAGD